MLPITSTKWWIKLLGGAPCWSLDRDLEWSNSGLPSCGNCSSEKTIMHHNLKWQCKQTSSAHQVKAYLICTKSTSKIEILHHQKNSELDLSSLSHWTSDLTTDKLKPPFSFSNWSTRQTSYHSLTLNFFHFYKSKALFVHFICTIE